MKKILLGTTIALTTLFIGCEKDEDDPPSSSSFDRSSLLQNFSDNLFIPALSDLDTETKELHTAVEAFTQAPSESLLTDVQREWEEAYLAFQYCNSLNFGPGDGTFGTFLENTATFPVNTALTESYIAQGDASFSNFDRDTRGFLVLEYLTFDRSGDNAAIVSSFSDANRVAYLHAVADDLVTRCEDLRTDWQTYRNEFIENDGTGSGSSIALFYNEWVKSFEAAKNFKVGLPAGKRPGQVQPEPDQVEAYYSGRSLTFLRAHLQAVENIYFGIAKSGADGVGFDDYVRTTVGGDELVQETIAQWTVVKEKLGAVPTSPTFSELVANESTEVDELHTELSRHTRYFKSEMSSNLGITITFDSGDGD